VGTASTYAQVNYSSSGSSVYESGSNGFDDDSDGVVDNPASPAVPAVYGVSTGFAASSGEMQYPAPYPSPLRGIQVKIRTYEPDSRQVREVTIVQDFLPQ
jgi:hypothetical protein